MGSQHRCEILPPKQNQVRNIIKLKRIRRGGFFPLRSAKRNISHHEVIYRIRRIYRAEGISCALRARGEGAKTSRKREVLLLPSGRQGRRPLEAQGNFALCGARLKKLFEKSFLRIFKSFPAAVVFYLIGNFRLRKFTLTSPIGRNLTHAQRDLISAQADHNSRFARS